MADKFTRTVGGKTCEVTLSLDCGGVGWVVTVRHQDRVIARGSGESREEVLSRVLAELRQRFQGEAVVVGMQPDVFLRGRIPLGEPLRNGCGKLPKRVWQ